jgi:hypothetical protein
MTDVVDRVAEKILFEADAVYARHGDSELFKFVTSVINIPLYFREMARLAAVPRSIDVWNYFCEITQFEADRILALGLLALKWEDLPDDEGQLLASVSALCDWLGEMSKQSEGEPEA